MFCRALAQNFTEHCQVDVDVYIAVDPVYPTYSQADCNRENTDIIGRKKVPGNPCHMWAGLPC